MDNDRHWYRPEVEDWLNEHERLCLRLPVRRFVRAGVWSEDWQFYCFECGRQSPTFPVLLEDPSDNL